MIKNIYGNSAWLSVANTGTSMPTCTAQQTLMYSGGAWHCANINIGSVYKNTGSWSQMLNVGVEGTYHFELGTRTELHEKVGIGPQAVLNSVRAFATSLSK